MDHEITLIYPVILSLSYPLIKKIYGGKVNEKALNITYSLAIYLPIYLYIAVYLKENLIKIFMIVTSLSTNFICLRNYYINFSDNKLRTKDFIFVLSNLVLTILLIVLT